MNDYITPEPTESTEENVNGMDTENTPIPEVSATPIVVETTPDVADYSESLQTIILNQERGLEYEQTTALYSKICAYILCIALFFSWLIKFMGRRG